MLVLTRRVGADVILTMRDSGFAIGTIKILAIVGGTVRLGFDCHDGVKILRDNTINKVADEKAATESDREG